MADAPVVPRSVSDYTVAIVCPMGVELAPVKAMLDHIHPEVSTQRDQNSYVLGDMVGHNVVVAVLPETGTNAAATVATQLLNDFPAVRFGLLVGIGGGVPDDEHEEDGNDIRLGDLVISKPTNRFGGVVQYDLGKHTMAGGFEHTGLLNKPPELLMSKVEQLAADHRIEGSKVSHFVSAMLAKHPAMQDDYSRPGPEYDLLFRADYPHTGKRTCRDCDKQHLVSRVADRKSRPKIHYGTIGSANAVVKDAVLRDKLQQEMQIMCVEMEAAGLMNDFPCLVVRGICDYADSHKSKKWQPYAAAVAAAYAKELLSTILPKDTANLAPALNAIQKPKYDRGLNLFEAPDIDGHQFVGRMREIEQIQACLLPGHDFPERRVLVLGGMGGIGKTQIAIAYAKRYRHHYSSIFWLNAASETTLKSSLRLVATRIKPAEVVNDVNTNDDQIQVVVMNWLSELDNSRWLLIFDNYDEPGQYSINSYYPYVSHGSIMITSRLPDYVHGRPVRVAVQSCSIEDGLEILSRRSEREHVHDDIHAQQLATKLAGLPLALATAGACLHKAKTNWSFEQYLASYEQRWYNDLHQSPVLSEYQNRTLYTTWDTSYALLEIDNPTAAKFLKLLAYFDNQSFWYELFRLDNDRNDIPQWLADTIVDPISFESIIRVLVDYCLVEVQLTAKTNSVHNCVHDWITARLNRTIDPFSYWYAFDCVSSSIPADGIDGIVHTRCTPIALHAVRLVHDQLSKAGEELPKQYWRKASLIATLLIGQNCIVHAIAVCRRLLSAEEKLFGPEDGSTLNTSQSLGNLYAKLGMLDEAEEMFTRVLIGREKLFGSEHDLTLNTSESLGMLYQRQGKFNEAEEMFARTLAGRERLFGPEHELTLEVTHSLSTLYEQQGMADKAKETVAQALAKIENLHELDHAVTLKGACVLSNIYKSQGKLDKATATLERVLDRLAELPHSPSLDKLHAIFRLGSLYKCQGKLDKARDMSERCYSGCRETLGPDHPYAREVAFQLDILVSIERKWKRLGAPNLEQGKVAHEVD